MSKRYKEWWAKNSERISAGRRQRYASDEAYREHVNARNRASRLRAKADQPARPAQYTHDMRAAADDLGVTVSSLRWWITAGYCPRPTMHDGKFWLTDHQVALLMPIAQLFADHPEAKTSEQLEVLKNLAWMNWGT